MNPVPPAVWLPSPVFPLVRLFGKLQQLSHVEGTLWVNRCWQAWAKLQCVLRCQADPCSPCESPGSLSLWATVTLVWPVWVQFWVFSFPFFPRENQIQPFCSDPLWSHPSFLKRLTSQGSSGPEPSLVSTPPGMAVVCASEAPWTHFPFLQDCSWPSLASPRPVVSGTLWTAGKCLLNEWMRLSVCL